MGKNRENPLINLVLNIIIPSYILIKLSDIEYLGPVKGIITALLFPFFYGIYGLIIDKKINFFSILGLISILLTGVFGLLSLDSKWIIVKEAGIPFLLGLAILISLKTPFPFIKKLFMNEQFFDIDRIQLKLEDKKNTERFEKRLSISTLMLSGSFFLSSFLNIVLAKIVLISEPGTSSFNKELGLMTAYSFPVIAVPSTIILILILIFIIRSIITLTGITYSEIFSKKLVNVKA